jgi:hypothetical protein
MGRLLIFKGVFLASVLISFGALFVYGVFQHIEDLQSNATEVGRLIAKEHVLVYQWPVIGGSLLLAGWFAFGDLYRSGKSKGRLPTYTDDEFIAKFGGKTAGSD